MAIGRHPALYSLVLALSLVAVRAAEAAGATPIDIDENVFASIEVAGEHDLYTFEAAAGDVIWIRMAVEGSFIEPRLELSAPGGGVIANGSTGVTISDIVDLPLAETGTYTLDAYDANDNETGAYSLQVIRIGNGAPLDFGPPDCGAVEANCDRDVYTFEAVVGDLIWLRVSTLSATQPRTRLYGPDHALLVTGNGTNTTSDILDYVLPATGTYTLVVYSNNPNAGAYCQHLLRISDPVDDLLIEYGPVYADSIATLGEIDAFTFDAEAGDVVWLRMARRSLIDCRLRLYDPAGTFIASATGITVANVLDVTLPASGTYTLLAYDGNSNGTGAYELELLRISDPVDPIVTAFGPVECDDFEGNTKRTAFQIDGVAGDLTWFRITSPNAVQPRLRLYAPDFTLAATSSTNNTGGNILDFVLPSTGLYTLLAYSDNGNAGVFCVHGVRISNPNDDVAIAYGPVTAGELEGLADIDVYTFSADADDLVWIRMTRQGTTIWPRMRLYDPSFALIASGSANINVSDILDLTLPGAGTYTLLAYEANLNQSDPYTLHLLRENDPTDAVELTLGSEHCASLEDGAIDAYTFPALAGDSLRARMVEESSGLEPRVRLLDPDGVVIIGGSGNVVAELLAEDLPVDGIYKLLAYDDLSNDPGDYRVEVEVCLEEVCGDFCAADVTNDREVGFDDLLVVLSGWGSCDCCPADVDGNGAVDFDDVLLVLAAWGPCL